MFEFKELWEQVLVKYVLPYSNNKLKFDNYMAKAFQYCVIMRTDEGIEDFLDYNDSDYSTFFRNRIINLLGLKDEPESDKIVVNYLLKQVYENGFVVHTTNSLAAEKITSNGFAMEGLNENTTSVYDELKNIIPKTFFDTNLNFLENQTKKDNGWFFDNSPYNYSRYKDGPEWFKRLTNGNYTRRDYEASKNFILNVVMRNEPEDKKEQALRIFNKYWAKYSPTTSHMLLVGAKNIFEIKQQVMSIIEKKPVDVQILFLTTYFFMFTDNNTKSIIYPNEIIDVDMTQLKQEYEDRMESGSIRM